MARGGKVKMNFDFKKLSRKVAGNVVTGINELGKRVNIEIGKNLKKGIDINEKSLKKLSSTSTIPIRERRGQGSKPLVISGKMEERKIKQATVASPSFEIEMVGKSKRTEKIYGAFHHTGYTTSPNSAIPNRKVPARKWFGVSKSCRPGGDQWKKSIATTQILNRIAWDKSK